MSWNQSGGDPSSNALISSVSSTQFERDSAVDGSFSARQPIPPLASRGYDFIQGKELRMPFERHSCSRSGGHQEGRIARPRLTLHNGQVISAHAFNAGNNVD